MISFKDLKNYIINDPLSDWFEKINHKYDAYESTEPTKFELNLRENKYQYKENFIDFLMSSDYEINKDQDYQSVKRKINKKDKCIFIKPTLYHDKYNLNIIPDFIIHRDIFKEIFNGVHIPDLPDKSLPQSLPLYIVSDIVYQTVYFNSDMTDLINEHLPADVRMDYLKMINDVYITKQKRDDIINTILDILQEYGYYEEG